MNKKLLLNIFITFILLSSTIFAKTNTANTTLGKVFTTWENWGIFDIFLPLILIFLILFLAFVKSGIFSTFGTELSRRYSAITAFITSMITLVPHFTQPASRFDVIHIINNAMPKITLSLTMIVFILILYGILFGSIGTKPGISKTVAAWGASILVILIYIDSALGQDGWMLGSIFYKIRTILGSEDLLAFTFFIVLGIVMWFITKPTKDNKEEKKEESTKKKNSFTITPEG